MLRGYEPTVSLPSERPDLPALRHRLILNFQAEADNVTPDSLVLEVMRSVRRP
jgi:hypothetical protein